MKVVVVGATGNCGTSLVRALSQEDAVDAVTGVARRLPDVTLPKVEWASADIERADLVPLFRGADAVVSLAWRIQPSHDLDALWRTNVEGTTRVMRAAREAGVPALVYASSVGAYSPGPKDAPVDESWPTYGIPLSFYARHKAEVERRLDAFERDTPEMRVVRVRPALVFKREAATARPERWFAEREIDGLDAEAAVAALEALPPEQREVIVGRLWGGMTLEQIAGVAGCSVSSAHRRFEAGILTLRERLGVTCPK